MPLSLTRKATVFYCLTMLTTAGLFFNHVLHLRTAQAQTANGTGVCQDPWLDDILPVQKATAQNIDGFGKNINGFGVQGECNPKLYHNGSWSSKQELTGYVTTYLKNRKAGVCRDPLLTSTITQVWRRAPRGFGESQDCNMYLYGGGSWSSQQDLTNKIQANKNDFATANLDFSIGGLVRPSSPSKVIQPLPIAVTVSGTNIVAAGAGNIVAAGAGNIILNGGGNIVAAGAGNIVAAGAGNIILSGGGTYHTLAVGTGVPAKLVKVGSTSTIIPVGK